MLASFGSMFGSSSAPAPAPVQQEMGPVILTQEQYFKLDPTANLAKVTREEAMALLKVNSSGVTEFFNRKGCSSLSQALGKEGINGETLSQLAPKYVEQLPVSLGEKLGLLAFMKRFGAAAKSGKRSEVIWQGDDYTTKLEKLDVAPCCGLCKCGCEFNCCKKPKLFERLPAANYKVTNTSFKKLGYVWADGTTEQAREVDFQPNCGVGWLCGWRRGNKFVYTESTDNIDLSNVLDVDVQRQIFEPETFHPKCKDRISGYKKELIISEPAKLFVTYTTPDQKTELLTVTVSPEDPQKIADLIIAAKEEAQAEDAGAGKVDM